MSATTPPPKPYDRKFDDEARIAQGVHDCATAIIDLAIAMTAYPTMQKNVIENMQEVKTSMGRVNHGKALKGDDHG